MGLKAQYCVAVTATRSNDTWDDWRNTPVGRELYRMSNRDPRVETHGGITYLMVDSRNNWTPLRPEDLTDQTPTDWRYISRDLFYLAGMWEVMDLWYARETDYSVDAVTHPSNRVTKPRIAARDRAE